MKHSNLSPSNLPLYIITLEERKLKDLNDSQQEAKGVICHD